MESRDWSEAPAGARQAETRCDKEGINHVDHTHTNGVETEDGNEAMRCHLSRHVLVLFATLIALSASPAVTAAQFFDPLRAALSVSDAEPQSEARLFRVYETPKQLTLLLTLANQSSRNIFVDQTGLERNLRFTVNRDWRRVPISARWNRDAKQAGRDAPVAVSPGKSIQVDAVDSVEWRIDLERADGRTFPAGRYAIEVAWGDARDYVSTAAGQPWSGTTPGRGRVSVLVAPPTTARERAAAYRLAGSIALRGKRQAEAVQALQRARTADPTDHMSMVALGGAYLQVKRYAEAIVEFENALRVMPQGRSGVPMHLALAYVGLGDELNATRVLREHGMLESRISSELNQYRATIRARK